MKILKIIIHAINYPTSERILIFLKTRKKKKFYSHYVHYVIKIFKNFLQSYLNRMFRSWVIFSALTNHFLINLWEFGWLITLDYYQHHLERRPVHRNVATWQTSWRQKIVILIRMQFLNDIIKSRHGFKTAQKFHTFWVLIKTIS